MLTTLKLSTIVSIIFFENSSNSWRKLTLKLRICIRFAAIFYMECVAVLTMALSYVRIAVIVYQHYIIISTQIEFNDGGYAETQPVVPTSSNDNEKYSCRVFL